MFKKLAALVCAVWVAFLPNLALAQTNVTKTNGQIDAGGNHFYGIGYWNGSAWVPMRGDASGVMSVTEMYPTTNQFATTTVASPQPVFWCLFTALQPLGTSWTAAPYGQRVLNINKASTGSTGQAARIYVFGSEDNATWRPVIIPNKASGTAGNFVTGFSDTTGMDTLKFVLPFRSVTAAYSFSIPSWLYMGRYVQLFATKADTVASMSITIGAQWGGREY